MNLMALNRNQTKEEKKASAQKRVRARAMQASGKSSWMWQSWNLCGLSHMWVKCGRRCKMCWFQLLIGGSYPIDGVCYTCKLCDMM